MSLMASIKVLLFGYDFFISYAQEERTKAYGTALQSMLTARDYVVFRDTTELLVGEKLTFRIRWGLRRTRCLIVLGTERALESHWVNKEIAIFAERKRPIVPLDLEKIRSRHCWPHIDDALFEPDTLPNPSPNVVDRTVASLKGWRANKRARVSLGILALSAVTVASVLMWQAFHLRERALRMRSQSLVALAHSLPDPVAKTLVLAEADPQRLPEDAVRTAREIARSFVPETVLRISSERISAMTTSLNDRWVITADEKNVVRRWRISGNSDPVMLCILGFRPERMEAIGSMVFCCDDAHAALIEIDNPRAPQVFNKPQDDKGVETSVRSLPKVSRGEVAHGATAWRVSPDGKLVMFCADVLRVVAFIQGDNGQWNETAFTVPGRAVLDIEIHKDKGESRFVGWLVCTDGSLGSWACTKNAQFSVQWNRRSLVPKGGYLRLPPEASDARAFFSQGSNVVVGLGATDGILTASQMRQWKVQTYRPPQGRKLQNWMVAADGQTAVLQWEDGALSHIQMDGFRESPQPPSTRVRVLSQSDYVMGAEANEPDNERANPKMRDVALSADGDLVVLPTFRNAWLWSVKAGHPIGTLRSGMFFGEAARPIFTHDGARVITAEKIGDMRVWRTDGNQLDPRVVSVGGKSVKLASGKGGQVLVGTESGNVFLVESSTHAGPKLLYSRPGRLARCAVSPTGTRGAAIFQDGLVALFDLSSLMVLGTVQCERDTSKSVHYEDIEFAGEQRVIAFNGITPSLIDFTSHRILVRNTNTWDHVNTAEGRSAEFALIRTPADQIQLVAVPTLKVIRTFALPVKAKVFTSRLSPSGSLAAIGLGDGRILVYETSSNTSPLSLTVTDSTGMVFCVAFDPSERRVAFGTASGQAGFVDLRSPASPRWFQAPNLQQATGVPRENHAHLMVVIDAQFSLDGQRLLTTSGVDGFTRVWQLDGTCIEALHTSGVATFARFLADGRIVNLTEQGEIAFWRAGALDLIKHVQSRLNTTLLASERIRYLHEVPETAYRSYCEHERQCGRTPLPREFARIDFW